MPPMTYGQLTRNNEEPQWRAYPTRPPTPAQEEMLFVEAMRMRQLQTDNAGWNRIIFLDGQGVVPMQWMDWVDPALKVADGL